MAKKKILLTGGNGFIGKNIQGSFLADKYEIIAPRSFELNLLDTACVDEFFEDKNFDAVLHAGVKPGHRNAKDRTNLFYSNVRMFENLERNKKHFKKFINFGSGAVYDTDFEITEAKEEEIFKRVGTKDHDFCKYVEAKQIEHLDNFIDMNIFGIFGKYEDWEIRFISNAICRAIFELPITIRQNRRFSYLWVEDLMPVLDFFIENDVKFKSYNVVPNESTTLFDLAQLIKKVSGKNVEIEVANEGLGLDYTGDNTRLRDEFKDIKFTSMEQSVSALYNYYEKNKSIISKELLLENK